MRMPSADVPLQQLPHLDPSRPVCPRRQDLDGYFPQRMALSSFGPLTYRCAGAGPAVVLLHGIGSASGSWLDVALTLRNEFLVIAWDAPGYGGSAPLPQSQPAASDYADALHQLLTTIGVQDCILVGHSLGAIVAGAYVSRGITAGHFPVRRLVLLSPAQGYANDGDTQREAVRTHRLGLLETVGIDGMATKRASALLSDAASLEMREWASWNMRQVTPAGYRHAVGLLCDSNLLSGVAPEMPVDVRVGNHDTITPAIKGQRIAHAWRASFGLIEGAGHACHIERPMDVAGIVREAYGAPKQNGRTP